MLESILSEIKKAGPLAFKNNVPFVSSISKINGLLIENSEDVDVVMPMYNLLEYSKIIQRHLVLCGIIVEMT